MRDVGDDALQCGRGNKTSRYQIDILGVSDRYTSELDPENETVG